jgi:uncharacterized damage-inducible protein DinB
VRATNNRIITAEGAEDHRGQLGELSAFLALENGTADWAPPPMPATMKEVLEAYEQQSDAIVDRWEALPLERWDGTLEFFGRQRPASPMAWSFLFDIVHHRGQITTYLRPMGSTVPQVYGPSGDEP